jgi:hypothetical protein
MRLRQRMSSTPCCKADAHAVIGTAEVADPCRVGEGVTTLSRLAGGDMMGAREERRST